MLLSSWRVPLTCAVLVFGLSSFGPAAIVSIVMGALHQLSRVAVTLMAPPGPPQQMLRHVADQYLSPLAMRDVNGTTWCLLGLLLMLVIGVSLADHKLGRWNEQLAEMAMISPDLIQHYCGTSYEKAEFMSSAASIAKRPR